MDQLVSTVETHKEKYGMGKKAKKVLGTMGGLLKSLGKLAVIGGVAAGALKLVNDYTS
jgi:hypothetical protein